MEGNSNYLAPFCAILPSRGQKLPEGKVCIWFTVSLSLTLALAHSRPTKLGIGDQAPGVTLWMKAQHEWALTPLCIVPQHRRFHIQLDRWPVIP